MTGGERTPTDDPDSSPTTPALNTSFPKPHIPGSFYFETGYGLYAKRTSRPFPPPFISPPSGSFSDPLSTHDRSRDRRSYVDGHMIRGVTNGDDAVVVQENFIGANDGVGAWAQKDKGHAALWSRLILHFWSLEIEKAGSNDGDGGGDGKEERMVQYLQRAFEATQKATSSPNEWHGTTTASAALLRRGNGEEKGLLYVTNLGDSQIMVVRPSAAAEEAVVYKSKEQWHWFDCPRQLGTNSPDTPARNAVLDRVGVVEDDVVLAMSDGVSDNLWEHEIVANVVANMRDWRARAEHAGGLPGGRMQFVARQLVDAARVIAEDPYAESPYMERAIDEGMPAEGGKLDDISVVAAVCKRRKG